MARTPGNGGARPVTADGFNERIKRLFDVKPDPEQAPERQPGRGRPKPAKPASRA